MIRTPDGELIPGEIQDGLYTESNEQAGREEAEPGRPIGEGEHEGSANREDGHPDWLDRIPERAGASGVENGKRGPANTRGFTGDRERAGPDEQDRPARGGDRGAEPGAARPAGRNARAPAASSAGKR